MSYWTEVILEVSKGLENTFIIFGSTLLIALPLAALLALVYLSNAKVLQGILSTFIWIVRGSPLMLQLIFMMFGLPVLLGIPFKNRLLIASLTFIVNYTAYFIAMFHNGLKVIPKGQWEAAQMLQIPKLKTLTKIIYPQMIRNSLKSLENETITLLKDTALISTLALSDILRNAREILNRDQRIESLFIVLIMYLFFSFIIIQGFKYLQRKVRLT